MRVYKSAKENIVLLNKFVDKGFKKILLYGAGDVAEISLQTIKLDNFIPVKILAIVDDEISKHNLQLVNTKIVSPNEIDKIKHDGIVIASYSNNSEMVTKLIDEKYDSRKTLHFFD